MDDEFIMFYNRSGGRISVTYEPYFDYYHSNIIEYHSEAYPHHAGALCRDVDPLLRTGTALQVMARRIHDVVLMVYVRDYTVLDNTKGGTSGSSSGGSGSSGGGLIKR